MHHYFDHFSITLLCRTPARMRLMSYARAARRRNPTQWVSYTISYHVAEFHVEHPDSRCSPAKRFVHRELNLRDTVISPESE